MNLKWRCLLAMVIGITFGPSPVMALECHEDQRHGSTVGVILKACVDAGMRGLEAGDERVCDGIGHEGYTLSDDDHYDFHMAGHMGPYLVLVEEGTNHVRPFYYAGGECETVRECAEYIRNRYGGHRVRATGCIVDGNWPAIKSETIEILD